MPFVVPESTFSILPSASQVYAWLVSFVRLPFASYAGTRLPIIVMWLVATEYVASNAVPTVALLLMLPKGSNENVWFHGVPQFAVDWRVKSSYV